MHKGSLKYPCELLGQVNFICLLTCICGVMCDITPPLGLVAMYLAGELALTPDKKKSSKEEGER